jgi:hypothetical protein
MPIQSQAFEDWMGSTYYEHFKQLELDRFRRQIEAEESDLSDEQIDEEIQHKSNHITADILSADDICKIQSILRYESIKNSAKRLYLRIASFVNESNSVTEANSPSKGENEIYYDLCNPEWEMVRITRYGWDIIKHRDKILFKRHAISNAQVYPKSLENGLHHHTKPAKHLH